MYARKAMSLLLLVCSFALIQCGDDGGGGSGGNNGSHGNNGSSTDASSYAQFRQSLGDEAANIFCRGLFECPKRQNAIVAFRLGRFESEAECKAYFAERPEALLIGEISVERSIEEGRASFDSTKARACVAELQEIAIDTECPSFDRALSKIGACAGIVEGSVPTGEACINSAECASGGCEFAYDRCYGECVETERNLGAGESCEPGQCDHSARLTCAASHNTSMETWTCVEPHSLEERDGCASDLQCPVDSMCFDGTCTQPIGGGSFAGMNQPCGLDDAVCDPGLACRAVEQTADGWELECGTVLEQGSTCVHDLECAAGLYCEGSTDDGSQSGTCQPVIEAGETCDDSDQCGPFASCTSGDTEGPETCQPDWVRYGNDGCELPADEPSN